MPPIGPTIRSMLTDEQLRMLDAVVGPLKENPHLLDRPRKGVSQIDTPLSETSDGTHAKQS